MNTSKKAKFLMLCQSGKISPNLVTLLWIWITLRTPDKANAGGARAGAGAHVAVKATKKATVGLVSLR